MNKITIYSTSICPYCVRAKELLSRKGFDYHEINVDDIKEREKMIEKAGGKRTVPQIFIGNTHVGGCDDLYELEKNNKLDALVTGK